MKTLHFIAITLLVVSLLACKNSNTNTANTSNESTSALATQSTVNPKAKALMQWREGVMSEQNSYKKLVYPSTFDYISDAGTTLFYFNGKKELVLIATGNIFESRNSYWLQNNKLVIADISEHNEAVDIDDFVFFENDKPFCRIQNGQEVPVGDINILEEFNNEMALATKARKPAPEGSTTFAFSGTYTYTSTNVRDDMPEASISIRLEFEEQGSRTLLGGFSGYVQFGAKLEEGEDDFACSINGTAYSDIALLQCTSCYTGEIFFAYIFVDNGKFTWVAMDADAFIPAHAVLTRE